MIFLIVYFHDVVYFLLVVLKAKLMEEPSCVVLSLKFCFDAGCGLGNWRIMEIFFLTMWIVQHR
jgi:hypothetical protein